MDTQTIRLECLKMANTAGAEPQEVLATANGYLAFVEGAPSPKAEAADPRSIPLTMDDMVSRFLGWSLPDDFNPDGGIGFDRTRLTREMPTGTNLLDVNQARAMLEYVTGLK